MPPHTNKTSRNIRPCAGRSGDYFARISKCKQTIKRLSIPKPMLTDKYTYNEQIDILMYYTQQTHTYYISKQIDILIYYTQQTHIHITLVNK